MWTGFRAERTPQRSPRGVDWGALTEAVQQGQEVSVMKASDKNEHVIRHHTDAPAEGETEGWVSHDTGLHSQDPAEGPDFDDDDAPPSGA